MVTEVPIRYREPPVAALIGVIATSFAKLLGSPLVSQAAAAEDVVEALWNAPQAIVAHGTQPDPLFFFANRAALVAFESDLDAFLGMPSRFSAEAPERAERAALLDQVSRYGFIADYAGIRISAKGRRFPIDGAVVWNLVDDAGVRHGQAATFTV